MASTIFRLVIAFTIFTIIQFSVSSAQVEKRTLQQIYQAAIKEGGTLTVWHGGDETNQQDSLISAFKKEFPKIKLNLTVDLSKFIDGRVDLQIKNKNLECDIAILQTLHDYNRWKKNGALMNYKPAGWDQVYPQFKDTEGYWYGVYIYFWSNVYNIKKVKKSSAPVNFEDYLKPQYKKKLVLTYPNDDDAVLFLFDLIIQKYGEEYVDKLIAQKPLWVRGTATPTTIVSTNNTYLYSFTTTMGLYDVDPVGVSLPTKDQFVSWPQTGAIFKSAPHPEAAKLFMNFILSKKFQNELISSIWSVRQDIGNPKGFQNIFKISNTNVTAFHPWMMDRAYVERLRFWFESKIGSAQGKSPLTDSI